MKYKKYKKDFDYSYTLGASLTIELLKTSPQMCVEVFYSPDYVDKQNMVFELCEKNNIQISEGGRQINALANKENCYVIGIIKKEAKTINKGSHVVLVNPSDMGNLGTIMRTATGFYTPDIAVIRPCADIYDPKTIRASMGAFFHCNVEYFDTFEDYRRKFPENALYPFMLKGARNLNAAKEKRTPFSLIFGNEASGLDDSYSECGESIKIEHSEKIDSLNLPIAAAVALYEFTR